VFDYADNPDMAGDVDPEALDFVDVPEYVTTSDIHPMIGMLPGDDGYPEAAVFIRMDGKRTDDSDVSETFLFTPRDLLRVTQSLMGLAIEMEDAMLLYAAKNPRPKATIRNASPYL
jgi:hypothetical protein